MQSKIAKCVISLSRLNSSSQSASAKRVLSPCRAFSSTRSTNDVPQKLTDQEVAASVRLLTYQGTPFPWVAVSYVYELPHTVGVTIEVVFGLKISRYFLASFIFCCIRRQTTVNQSQKHTTLLILTKHGPS